MDAPLFPSQTEKHNAMISYCFLAVFMLISRQEQFTGKFVRSHARYATILHGAFLILIIAFSQSQSFSSVIIYDFTWLHGVLFVLFFGLLALLGNGIYSALKGEKPRISLSEFTLKSFEKEFTDEVAVSRDEKTSIILSHIPFLGIYLAAKYGGQLTQGEKFGTWFCIIAVIATFIDPSLTLLITMILGAMFWIVYQAVGNANTSTVRLIGNKLWGGRDAHIYVKSLCIYSSELFKHNEKMPSWLEIEEKTKSTYAQYTTAVNPLIYIPILNIALASKVWKIPTTKMHALQGIFITILFLYSIFWGGTAMVVLSALAGFWGYVQSTYHKDCNIPLIRECADMSLQIVQLWKNRSKTEEVHLTSTK